MMYLTKFSVTLVASLLVSCVTADNAACHVGSRHCITASNPKHRNSQECPSYGIPGRPVILSSCDASTFEDCRDACLDDKSCRSFGYTTQNLTCTFYSHYLKNMDFKETKFNLGSTFFNRHCFTRKCFKTCPTGDAGSQMVENPSFSNKSDPFADWKVSSTGHHQPQTETSFAPNGQPVAFWVSRSNDSPGVSASFSQTLNNKGSKSEPFQFSAWVGQWGYQGYEPLSVKVKMDGVEIFAAQHICTVHTDCQTFGDDTIYRQITAYGTMESANPLLEIVFAPTAIENYQIAYLNSVSVTPERCSD